jgi:hypothetical protein
MDISGSLSYDINDKTCHCFMLSFIYYSIKIMYLEKLFNE